MTTGALIMLLVVWAVVILFTAYFFWRVLTVPQRRNAQSDVDRQ